jgi:ferredoxin
MRVQVDLNRCQLYAQCCFLAPDIFKLEGEEALVYHPSPEEGMREKVLKAAAACPTRAITMEPEGLTPP